MKVCINDIWMDMSDKADLDKIMNNPEASMDETCMASAIWCGKIDRACWYADRVAKNKGKYYQHLYYFLNKYLP